MERFSKLDFIIGAIKARLYKYLGLWNFNMIDEDVAIGTVPRTKLVPFDTVIIGETLEEGKYPDFHMFSIYLEKILETKLEGGKVLISCKWGRGRSASLAVAYLMLINNMSLDEAITTVKLARSVVYLSSEQIRFLKEGKWREPYE